ncbi:6358_t:CDS:1, partial [Scutellospora calospora]
MSNFDNFSNEIFVEILLYLKELRIVFTSRRFCLIIRDSHFRFRWLVLNYNHFSKENLIRFGRTFFNVELIKMIIDNKNKFIDEDKKIETIFFHVAYNLHKTENHDNRVKALSIFEIIDSQYWLGYYNEWGYG